MVTLKGGKVGSVKRLKSSLKKGSASGFLRRVPKDGITVRFLEEPEEWIEYQEFYDEGDKAYYPITEGGPQPDADRPISKRFLANVVETAENKVVPLVIPKTLAQNIMKKYEKYGTLTDRDYEIVKDGEGLDTTYDCIPEPPARFRKDKYEPLDLIEVLLSQIPSDGDDDEDDEPPARSSSRRGSGSSARGRRSSKDDAPWDDDEDEEDDEPVKKRRPAKKAPESKQRTVRKPVRKSLRK